MPVTTPSNDAGWIVLIFSLPAKQASERVDVWRKLKRYGALPLRSGGHLLPNTPQTLERFEWLAASIRKFKGQASVMHVHSVDDSPDDELKRQFVEARSQNYEALLSDLKKAPRMANQTPGTLGRIRKRFAEIAAIDFFDSPLRTRVESQLARVEHSEPSDSRSQRRAQRSRNEYKNRTWITRPRPGIDRVSSAWLISRFIDRDAKFVFDNDTHKHPKAIPFDMFQDGGFGHRGNDCTFETLCKEFGVRDARVRAIAEMIHDADLEDGKFGRTEGAGLDRVLIGWAQQDVSDDELLRRGMQLIEGLYGSQR